MNYYTAEQENSNIKDTFLYLVINVCVRKWGKIKKGSRFSKTVWQHLWTHRPDDLAGPVSGMQPTGVPAAPEELRPETHAEQREAFQPAALTGPRHPCRDVQSWVSDECCRGSSVPVRPQAPPAHPGSASSGSLLSCVPGPSWAISQGLQFLWDMHIPLVMSPFEMIRLSLFYSYPDIAIKMVWNLDIIISHFFLYTSLKWIGGFGDRSHVIV